MGNSFGKKGGKGLALKDGESVRNVEYIIYPDQLDVPVGKDGEPMVTPHGRLVSFLETCGTKCALSPLHKDDVYDLEDVISYRHRYAAKMGLSASADEVIAESPDVGQPKEPHWHLHCYFAGQRKRDWLVDFIRQAVTDYPAWRIYRIENAYTATRYLAHLDCKTKPKYSANEVEGFGGMDLSPLWTSDEIESLHAIDDICEVIKSERIRYYNQLLDWALSSGDYNLLRSVRGNVSLWNNYLSGRAAEASAHAKRKSVGSVEELIG